MVMRPDSPVENMSQDEDWFKEYEWMNEQENFEEEFLNSLHIEEVLIFSYLHCFKGLGGGGGGGCSRGNV